MGTRARVVLHAPDEDSAAAAAGRAFAEITRLERIMSDYDPNSEAMRLCRAQHGAWHDVSPDLLDVLEKSRRVWKASAGAFDPTIGVLTRLWREARRTGELPAREKLDDARARVGLDKLRVDPDRARVLLERDGMRLDFGGIGKGYAAGRALDLLREMGHASALVEIGGDLALGEPPPGQSGWRIRVRTGLDDDRQLVLSNVGVATSGDLDQSVEIGGVRYSHILDPQTGLGLTERIAVTAIAPEAWLADALASAASVMDPALSPSLARRWPKAKVILAR